MENAEFKMAKSPHPNHGSYDKYRCEEEVESETSSTSSSSESESEQERVVVVGKEGRGRRVKKRGSKTKKTSSHHSQAQPPPIILEFDENGNRVEVSRGRKGSRSSTKSKEVKKTEKPPKVIPVPLPPGVLKEDGKPDPVIPSKYSRGEALLSS